VVTLAVSPADVDAMSGQLWLAGATAISEDPQGPGTVRLVAGFADEQVARAAAESLGGTLDLVDPGVWLDAWRAYAHPVRAGRLLVVPAWLDHEPVADGLRIDVDPGRVFGHGGHPTTRLVLEALDRRINGGEAVLDVGCGSGVLAIAAAALGAARVAAVDIDPDAVGVTLGNAARNGVTVDASTTPVEEVAGHFDLVLANIGADVLVALAPVLRALGDLLVLSGLLVDRIDEVAAAYAGSDAGAVETTTLDGWAALTVTTA
jgi:ribosomal protein L11 methyltransferase